MGLSNEQIERYARQIIVPGVGGIAQERLLSARLMIAGKASDVALVVAYMAGAGVGEIFLRLPPTEAGGVLSLIKRASELNPDVTVRPSAENLSRVHLILAVGAESEIVDAVPIGTEVPSIIVRLDEPARIAIFSKSPPCPFCADADLIAPPRNGIHDAGFVAMIAATEAFKFLAAMTPRSAPALFQFDGLAFTSRELRQDPVRADCPCSKRAQ
jgi:molybdopterin/thiamine biosynthesis adenylyltransferase